MSNVFRLRQAIQGSVTHGAIKGFRYTARAFGRKEKTTKTYNVHKEMSNKKQNKVSGETVVKILTAADFDCVALLFKIYAERQMESQRKDSP